MTFPLNMNRKKTDADWQKRRNYPGVMVYGNDSDGAVAHAQALALHVVADRLENGEEL